MIYYHYKNFNLPGIGVQPGWEAAFHRGAYMLSAKQGWRTWKGQTWFYGLTSPRGR